MTTDPSDLSSRRLPSLDGLRGLAILLVVAFHLGFVVHPAGSGPARTYVPGGYVGVDVFFVLSGFLITALLLEERHRTGGVSFRGFYSRRAYRLLPALGVLLAAHVAYAAYEGVPVWREVEALISISFYSSNISQALHLYMPAELGQTWSLAVEEQFYLVWPSLLLLLLGWRLRKSARTRTILPWVFISTLVLTNVARTLTWRTEGYPAAIMMPYCHADGLAIGCALAFLWKQGKLPVRNAGRFGWAALLGLLAFTFFWPQGPAGNLVYYGGYTLLALAAAAIVNAVLVGARGLSGLLSVRPLTAIGRVSYGLYLWHLMILDIVVQHGSSIDAWSRAGLGLALSAAATAASWYFVERPFLRLKARYNARGGSAVPVPGPA